MEDPSVWQLGQTSEQYESGGHGSDAISTGIDDPGGVSYGIYQFSSKKGTVKEYLDQSAYKNQFQGLEPTTPTFDAKWRELANNDPGFGRDQYNFIKVSHYEKQVAHLKADGLDLSDRGPAVQDALWSTSVQYRGRTHDVFEKGLQEKFGKDYRLSDLSDKDIVGAVQDYKAVHNDSLFASAPAKTRQHILDRIENEKVDLLSLAEGKVIDHSVHRAHSHATNGILKLGAHGVAVSALQADLAALGYTDNRGKPLQPDGHYGRNTEAAVMAFQSDHGLHSDGVAGKNTFDALRDQRQLLNGIPALTPELQGNPHPRIDRIDPANRAPAQRDPRAPALPDAVPPSVNPYADPRHPNHGLYAELRERIPNASENRIVECAAACHMAGIRSGELGQIHLRGKEALVFAPNGGAGGRAEVALTSPAPPIQQTMQHVQGFEQSQQMAMAQMNAQQQQTGPVMGGPRMG